jgi:hypothetical protein
LLTELTTITSDATPPAYLPPGGGQPNPPIVGIRFGWEPVADEALPVPKPVTTSSPSDKPLSISVLAASASPTWTWRGVGLPF